MRDEGTLVEKSWIRYLVALTYERHGNRVLGISDVSEQDPASLKANPDYIGNLSFLVSGFQWNIPIPKGTTCGQVVEFLSWQGVNLPDAWRDQ